MSTKLFFVLVLEIQRALCMLGKHCTIELHTQPQAQIFLPYDQETKRATFWECLDLLKWECAEV